MTCGRPRPARRHHAGRAHPYRGQPVGGRGVLPERETGMRPGRLPGPPLPRPAPPHDPGHGHGRPRLPHHTAGPRTGHGQSRNGFSQLIHLSQVGADLRQGRSRRNRPRVEDRRRPGRGSDAPGRTARQDSRQTGEPHLHAPPRERPRSAAASRALRRRLTRRRSSRSGSGCPSCSSLAPLFQLQPSRPRPGSRAS